MPGDISITSEEILDLFLANTFPSVDTITRHYALRRSNGDILEAFCILTPFGQPVNAPEDLRKRLLALVEDDTIESAASTSQQTENHDNEDLDTVGPVPTPENRPKFHREYEDFIGQLETNESAVPPEQVSIMTKRARKLVEALNTENKRIRSEIEAVNREASEQQTILDALTDAYEKYATIYLTRRATFPQLRKVHGDVRRRSSLYEAPGPIAWGEEKRLWFDGTGTSSSQTGSCGAETPDSDGSDTENNVAAQGDEEDTTTKDLVT
ncbi:hypothetical protein F5Y18DRAFT_425891 [Xylariaceae sp. FL1019]|nr:hypothetical protein F5Y18DRAFT_425891 [Xylariaceae sp. FL1019]